MEDVIEGTLEETEETVENGPEYISEEADIVGQNIRKLRKMTELTQKDLADKLCVSDKTVSKWENGKSTPDIYSVKKMAKLFDVSVDYMYSNMYLGEPAQKELLEETEECEDEYIAIAAEAGGENESEDKDKIITGLNSKLEQIHHHNKKRTNGLLMVVAIIGAILAGGGAYVMFNPYVPFSTQIRGDADGPTAIYLQIKISGFWSGFMCVFGVVMCISCIIVLIIRRKRDVKKVNSSDISDGADA